MHIHGRAIHPGWAKGELVNAIKLAGEILSRLPQDSLSPETTDGREGYVHPVLVDGRLVGGRAALHRPRLRGRPPRRAHRLPARARRGGLRRRAALLDRGRGPDPVPQHARRARAASRDRRATSRRRSAASASSRSRRRSAAAPTAPRSPRWACPTPNIFTGGHDAHSEREWICVEDMGLAAATLVELASVWAE